MDKTRLREIGLAHIGPIPPLYSEPNPAGLAILRRTISIGAQTPCGYAEAMAAYIELQRPLIEARRREAQANSIEMAKSNTAL